MLTTNRTINFFILSAVLALLSACGGGGGGGSAVVPTLPPMADIGDEAPAAPEEILNSSGDAVDTESVIDYYSGAYGSSDTLDNSSHFLPIESDQTSWDEDGYAALIGELGSNAFGWVFYELADDNTQLTVVRSDSFGEMTSTEATIAITINSTESALHINYDDTDSFVVLSLEGADNAALWIPADEYDFYSYRLLEEEADGAEGQVAPSNEEGEGYTYRHFIAGDYASLGYSYETNYFYRASSFTFGALSNPERLPTTRGEVSYALRAAGIYNSGRNDAETLFGVGHLYADFGTDNVVLDLDINTLDGAYFANVYANGLDFDEHRNGDFNRFASRANANVWLDFDDATGLTDIDNDGSVYVFGSFYGPNADEVAGGLGFSGVNVDSGNNSDESLELGFIGRQQQQQQQAITLPAIPEVGDMSPLNDFADVIRVDGYLECGDNNCDTLITVLYNYVDTARVAYHYANAYGNADTLANNRHFLPIASRHDENDRRGENDLGSYWVNIGELGSDSFGWASYVRNDANAPLTVDSVNLTAYGGLQDSNIILSITLSAGVVAGTVHVNYDGSAYAISLAGADNAALSLSADDYDFHSYRRLRTTNTDGTEVYRYNHFIAGDYAALQFYHDTGKRDGSDNILGYTTYTFGALTSPERLPTFGQAYYALNAVGAYTDFDDNSNSDMLFGDGFLTADFDTDRFDLNLDIDNINGDDFVNISAAGMRLETRNNSIAFNDALFRSFSEANIYLDFDESTGLPDAHQYLGDGRLYAFGTFYGPNAEEVGGGIGYYNWVDVDGDNNTYDENFDIGFIGKRFDADVADIVLPQAFAVGDLAPVQTGLVLKADYESYYIDRESLHHYGSYIDTESLLKYYARAYDNSDTLANNRHFLPIASNREVWNDDWYWVYTGELGTNNFNWADYYYDIQLDDNGVPIPRTPFDPSVQLVVGETGTFGTLQVAGNTAIAITLTTNNVYTYHINDDGSTYAISLAGADSAVHISADDYDLYTYKRQRGQSDDGSDVYRFGHFIAADYVALQLYHDSIKNERRNHVLGNATYTFGALTRPERLPTSGQASYALNAAGVYNTSPANEHSEMLFGSGDLTADFSADTVGLTLDINTLGGADFVNVSASNLCLCRNDGNQFTSDSDSSIHLDFDDTTGLTDANDAFIFGSFYGPNAEEVGGGVSSYGNNLDSDSNTNEYVDIGFIGKRSP